MTSPVGGAVVAAERAALARPWVKAALYAGGFLVVALIVGVLVYRFVFYSRDVARGRGAAEVSRQVGAAAADTGHEAVATVTRTYEYHTQVDRLVKEGQAHVSAQSDIEGADAAGAAALCGMHDDLCRDRPAAAP